MAGRDYYEEAHQLSRLLADEGLEDWARRIEEAIAGGFTASEILMALRWQSQQLQGARPSLSREVRHRLRTFLAGLEQALS
ncbi:MAG: hypothetical protein GY835_09070 [bacterium]|nr:hypothetical protein [bacterium]